jgi:N6-L-threonylcarbamoyladenine synthase
MITLGIETSCDDTSCGIVNDQLEVLANKIYTQLDQHKIYGGVVPEVASRAHLEKVSPIVSAALDEAGITVNDVDLFAFTRGPGLVGPLLVGASFARGLAMSLNKPIEGVNHLEGHLAAAYLGDKTLKPPFLCLTVSGGHTELCLVKSPFEYEILGKTRDDAAGEAFDKCGKILGLGYPAGPIVSKYAQDGDRHFISFPQGLNQKDNWEFSFSGLKTAFLRYVESNTPDFLESHKSHICASLEYAIVEILVKKSISALKHYDLSTIAVCGGVSANHYLRTRMEEEAQKRGMRSVFPTMSLCTDNGAMIAGVAQMRHTAGALTQNVDIRPNLSWF